jgi:hypothetical protein
VLENYRRLLIRADHAVVIPRGCRPGEWFAAGKAVIAPLHRKRTILLPRPKWVHVWTLYNEKSDVQDWYTPPDSNANLHFPIDVRSRDSSGWLITIPGPIRDRNWLPVGGGHVILEYSASEMNLWTEDAYNEEAILEADAS